MSFQATSSNHVPDAEQVAAALALPGQRGAATNNALHGVSADNGVSADHATVLPQHDFTSAAADQAPLSSVWNSKPLVFLSHLAQGFCGVSAYKAQVWKRAAPFHPTVKLLSHMNIEYGGDTGRSIDHARWARTGAVIGGCLSLGIGAGIGHLIGVCQGSKFQARYAPQLERDFISQLPIGLYNRATFQREAQALHQQNTIDVANDVCKQVRTNRVEDAMCLALTGPCSTSALRMRRLFQQHIDNHLSVKESPNFLLALEFLKKWPTKENVAYVLKHYISAGGEESLNIKSPVRKQLMGLAGDPHHAADFSQQAFDKSFALLDRACHAEPAAKAELRKTLGQCLPPERKKASIDIVDIFHASASEIATLMRSRDLWRNLESVVSDHANSAAT